MYITQLKSSSNVLDKSLLEAKDILKEFSLCDNCLGRLYAKKFGTSSNKLLGKKIKNILQFNSTEKCYICKGIFSNLDSIIYQMSEKSFGYKFSTFVVGAILKPSITDRDDQIRSKFKLQGIDSIKTAITKAISKKFAKKTRKKIDYLVPDLTFTYNFKNDSCELQSRTLIFSGRYIKKIRGLPQKQLPCSNCKGKGCKQCGNHGISNFDSVEGKIAKFLFEKFSGTHAKISWVGGEDKNSLVLGKGRPFFVKLLNPMKRNIRLRKKYILEGIEIHNLKLISNIPKQVIFFRSSIKLFITTQKIISLKNLNQLKSLKKLSIMINEKTKKNEKKIYRINLKKSSPKSFSMWITVDSGIPIKKFVEGGDVRPNLSEILGTKCQCKQFDFQKIETINSLK